MIPITQQIIPQPYITEITTNEATLNYPNQKQTTPKTHGFKHHSLPMIEPLSESPSQELAQSPLSPPKPSQQQLPPEEWAKMTNLQRKYWRRRHHK